MLPDCSSSLSADASSLGSAAGHKVLGLVGLGLLGNAIGQRLAAAGFTLHGFDPDPSAQARFAGLGQLAPSIPALTTVTNRFLFCLPNAKVVAEVAAEVLSAAQAGSVVLDATTGDPAMVEALALRFSQAGSAYLDCEVGGSSQQMASGQALLLLGGTADQIADLAPVLEALSPHRFHLGPAGAGTRMKLALNIAIGLHRAVLAESLTFAEANGISGDTALAVLRAGAGYSRAMDVKGEKMLREEFHPQARLAQHAKDVDQILATAAAVGAWTPLSALHQGLLQLAIGQGLGPLDNSAIIRLYRGTAAASAQPERTEDSSQTP